MLKMFLGGTVCEGVNWLRTVSMGPNSIVFLLVMLDICFILVQLHLAL
jgi:hypothetical protein